MPSLQMSGRLCLHNMLPDKCNDIINTLGLVHPMISIIIWFESNVEAKYFLQIPLQLVAVSERYSLIILRMRDENWGLKRQFHTGV